MSQPEKRNPKITVTYECVACNGTGTEPEETSTHGMGRTYSGGGQCSVCLNVGGPDHLRGKIVEAVTIPELRAMLAER